MSYTDDAQALREQYILDDTAQAPTVQGELLRSIDALRAQALDHGNASRTKDHAIMVDFLREMLCAGELFDEPVRTQLGDDLDAIASTSGEDIDRRPYDRIVERIVDWDRLHPGLMPHHPNPALTI